MINRLKCWLRGHRWHYVSVYPYRDTSWQPEGHPGIPSVMYLRRCECCHKEEDGHHFGCTSTKDQLNGFL